MPTLVHHKNGIFYLVYSEKGKRTWRSLRTRDRKTAYQLHLKAEDGITPNKMVTLRQAQTEFISYVSANLSPGATAVYRNLFRQFNKFLSDRLLAEVTPHDIDCYKISRREKVSPATVNHDLRHLRAFFNRLVLWEYLEKSPCQGIQDIKQVERIPLYLSKQELDKLLQYTKGTPIHGIILIGAMTGLRRGEILNLTWNDVDLNRGLLLVRSGITYRTKNGKIRMVPLNKTARCLLEGIQPAGEFIFPGDRGGPYNHDFLTHRFKKAILGCGLNPKLHFHSLRHTFASLLVQEGVPLYNVQRLLGHSSMRVTEIYAHLGQPELMTSVEKLELGT